MKAINHSYITIGISNPVADIRSTISNTGFKLTASGVAAMDSTTQTNSFFKSSYENLKFSATTSHYSSVDGNIRVTDVERFRFYTSNTIFINVSDKRVVMKNRSNIPVYLEPIIETIKNNPSTKPVLGPLYEEYKGHILVIRTMPYISPRHAIIKNSLNTDLDLYDYYENLIKSKNSKNENVKNDISVTDLSAIDFVVKNYNQLSERSLKGDIHEHINCHQLLKIKVSIFETESIIVNKEFILSSKNIFDVEDFPENLDEVENSLSYLGGGMLFKAYMVNNGSIAGKKFVNFAQTTIEVDSIEDPNLKSGLYIDKIKDRYGNVENVLFIAAEDIIANRAKGVFNSKEEAVLHRELSFDKIKEAQEREQRLLEQIRQLNNDINKRNHELETLKMENTILDHKLKSELAAAKFVQDTKKIEREMVKDTTKFNNELILGLTTAIGGVLIGTTLARK